MASFAAGTTVSPEKSRLEVETMLQRAGATQFASMTDYEARQAVIGFRLKGLQIKMEIPLPDPANKQFTHETRNIWRKRPDAKAAELYQGEIRRRWRCLALAIKAKMVAVADGVTTFEKEFMPYVVTEDGRTIGDRILPALEEAKASGIAPSRFMGRYWMWSSSVGTYDCIQLVQIIGFVCDDPPTIRFKYRTIGPASCDAEVPSSLVFNDIRTLAAQIEKRQMERTEAQ